jgi:hypothetical protein
MALADPQTITVNAVAKVMPRVLSEAFHSVYELADLTFKLEIRHRQIKRNGKSRIVSNAAFSQRKIVPDPLTSVNDYEIFTDSVQFDRPEAGYTSVEVQQHHTGFSSWLDSTMVDKIYGRQS